MKPWMVAALLAAAYLVLDPRTGDLVAQEYRASLGPVLWDNGWYAGHHVPAYSLTFPPLGALLGARLVGALSAVAATLAFARLAGRVPGAWLAGAWLAFGMATQLVANRLTFALGAAVGIAALAAARAASERSAPDPPQGVGVRWISAIALAAATSVSSPVAGAFLALAGAAWWLTRDAGADAAERGTRLPLAGFVAASVVPAGVVSVGFPEGGDFPFSTSSFLPALAGTLLVLALLPREHRTLRLGTALSLVVLVASWVLTTPMGGNAIRLGTLAAGPLLALALVPARRYRALALAAPFLLYWQLSAPVQNWQQTRNDPTIPAIAFTGVTRFLASRPGPPFRIEAAFTANHWEALRLARRFPLARGWERQYDRKVNALFYEDGLTAGRLTAWLDANAVRFVALADTRLDASARAEAALLRAGVPGLRRVYADRVWTVWEREDARPIGVSALTTTGFTTSGAGSVRIRWSPWFRVTGGRGCVRRTGDGYTEATGPVTVRARLGLGGVLRRDESCS